MRQACGPIHLARATPNCRGHGPGPPRGRAHRRGNHRSVITPTYRPAVQFSPAPARYVQATIEELGTALADVTFVVVDLETTGGSPKDSAIT